MIDSGRYFCNICEIFEFPESYTFMAINSDTDFEMITTSKIPKNEAYFSLLTRKFQEKYAKFDYARAKAHPFGQFGKLLDH